MDATLDQDGLGTFLRARRRALQPEDVGLRRGARRRTSGLRRDHLFLLAGHRQPGQQHRGGHISPGLMRVMDRLRDTPAQIMGSDEFATLWNRHEVGLRWTDAKRFIHPEVGRLDLFCQTLLDPDQAQSLLIFTATPGTGSHEKLALLTVLGTEAFAGT